MTVKEDYAIILDYLQYGYPMEKSNSPVAQAIGVTSFILLELIPRRGSALEPKEKVYIGPDKRDKIYFIKGRLLREKLTESAKTILQEIVENEVSEKEAKYIEFFNKSQPINTRLHQLELLPGFGKKHTKEILEAREEKAFESFNDIKGRVKSIPDPKKAIEKRIMEELVVRQRFNLFTR